VATIDTRADFQIILDNSISALDKLRTEAWEAYKGYSEDQAEWDAAYQIWQDLDRAHAEMTRTRLMISEGVI
jgi:hypothetical protein